MSTASYHPMPHQNSFWDRRRAKTYSFAEILNNIIWKFTKFASVGICATGIQYVLLVSIIELYKVRVSAASTIAFVVAAAVNYLLNRRFTFNSIARHTSTAPKFLTVALVGITLNAAVIRWLEIHTTFHYILAQTCATSIVLLWNFTSNAVWTFKSTD